MFGLHKHKRVEYARSFMQGGFVLSGFRRSGDHTMITFRCVTCGRFDQQTLIGHIWPSTTISGLSEAIQDYGQIMPSQLPTPAPSTHA